MKNKLLNLVLTASILLTTSLVNLAQASLITSVDNNVVTTTYDNGSQEMWLQFDQSSGLTVEDFITGNNNSFLADGWALASNSNMANLINNFFDINDFYGDENGAYSQFLDTDLVKNFLDIFGETDNGIIQVALGHDLDGDSNYNLFYTSSFGADTTQVTRHIDFIGYNYQNGNDGLALIKNIASEVPEPAIFMLFSLSLMLLGLGRFKRNS